MGVLAIFALLPVARVPVAAKAAQLHSSKMQPPTKKPRVELVQHAIATYIQERKLNVSPEFEMFMLN